MPEKMKDTLALWDTFRQGRYEVYLSDIVINEIGCCNQEKLSLLLDYLSQIEYHIIQTNEDTVALAEKFINLGILKQKSLYDCKLIAAAIIADIRKIREYNSLNHVRMSPKEIVDDTRKGAVPVLKMLEERKAAKE